MISFRYHVISLVAVLFALAAGIGLGSGLLDKADDQQPAAAPAISTDRSNTSGDEARLDAALVESVAPGLVANRLRGQTVALVVLPGASTAAEKDLSAAVESAGGTLTGVVKVGGDLVDPAKKQLVDALGGQLENSAKGVTIPAAAGTYDRIGALLGYAVAAKQAAGDATNAQSQSILAGLSTAGLASVDGKLGRRGGLVLILGGAPTGNPATDQGTSSIVASLASGMDSQSGGVVVAGPVEAAGSGGVLAAIRADTAAAKAVSTVDSAEGTGGAVVVVGALAEQTRGAAGQYGVGDGTTGVLPGSTGSGE